MAPTNRRRTDADRADDSARAQVSETVRALASNDPQVRAAARCGLTQVLPQLTEGDAHLLGHRERAALWACLDDASHVDAPFQMAVLKALEQIGDAGALPHVARLADGCEDEPLTPHEEHRLARHMPVARDVLRRRDQARRSYEEARQQWVTASEWDLRPLLQAREEAEAACRSVIAAIVYREGAPVHAAARRCLPLLKDRIERLRSSAHLLRPADAPASETLLRPAEVTAESDPDLLLRPAAPDE